MASQELVGRPLVPFFDNDENVNDSLQFAEGEDEREEMKIDARVWDKELGYFVYPSEQQTLVSIGAETWDSRTDSGKLLLTPSMMLSSSSAPDFSVADGNILQATIDGARPHSSSAKRESKQKAPSNTPGRRRKEGEGVEDVSAANTSSRKGKSKGSNTNSSGTQSSNSQQSRTGKQKEQLSASGKWAWSAFQKSPDPTELPMPPFLIKPIGGLSNDAESFSMTTSPTLTSAMLNIGGD
ncbi:unnamed protein product [Peronospora destructor]|uniref:Transcription factor TFIIIC triple barrel domain-containing protein n=1 Tax=Peronospora destructor TaxID=86335 RepID=A0AAV0TGS0_9STRA|nr:unnamed protein product [Peronospora destructor]